MKGDFTRLSFAARKNYTQVLKQQGRVDLDADWNEQGAIIEHLRGIALGDVIGRTGIPRANGDFPVELNGDSTGVVVGPGRIYVEGLICEIEEALTVDLPGEEATAGQTDLAVLDVWQRHVTALEDPDIREVALGGPDTTTRLQTICQLRILADAGTDCDSDDADWFPDPGAGRLSTGSTVAPPEASPCDLPPRGGFRGLENRLYRVEIHDGGDLGGATWKWSRDNGAVVFAIEEFPGTMPDRVRVRRLGRDQVLTLQRDDWVEILDDERELAGEPGFMARVDEVDESARLVKLDRDIPTDAFSPDSHARIRRWDQQDGASSDGLLTAQNTTIELEDGVEVTLSGGDFRPGDYWVFAARTVTREVESLSDAAPAGIEHHFCRLATIRWTDSGGETPTPTLEPCDIDFPPLTDITADDVSYDPTNCDLTDARTVQDAIDRLCQERDLRHHNKHLHGWGIVCGLQVNCGDDVASDERRSVTVRPGYAIDCDGNDIIVEQDEPLDVLTAIAELNEEDPNDPVLDENGDGEVCIRLETGQGNGSRFTFEKYQPEQRGIQELLRGTLLLDFYQKCIVRVIDWIRDEFTPDEGEEEMLVGPTQRRLISFLNLIVQLWNPTNGRYVFLSRREHTFLRSFYDGLRGLLQSRTFCAMFENARPFPDYPFDDDAHSTIFGKGNHSRIRIDPRGTSAYTVGASNRVHRFDLASGEMVTESEFPGGEGAVVRDVAFSEEGDEVYAIATVNNSTLFASGEVDGTNINWRPVSVICDGRLVTLGRWAGAPRMLYAVCKGIGLYRFDPEEPQVRPERIHQFNAVGHLAIDDETGTAFVTGAHAESGITDRYDRLLRIDLDDPEDGVEVINLTDSTGNEAAGDDDMALDPVNRRVAVVINGPQSGTKELSLYQVGEGQSPVGMVTGLENTEIRLGYSTEADRLVLSFEDSFRLGLVETQQGFLVPEYRHPVQISPMAMAFSPDGSNAYVLNQVSNTINTIPAHYLSPDGQMDIEALAEYRTGVIDAFMDLLGGFLQYLKDCFCDHFLVDCPECDGDETIYLGCASIRGGEVFRVCNFSRRKYVKSFPTVEYWMSVVPIWPMVWQAVERFCCSVPVSFFRQREAPQEFRYEQQASAANMRQGMTFMQSTDFRNITRAFTQRTDILRTVGRDWVGTGALKRSPITVDQSTATVTQREVVEQSVETATARLEENNVSVAGVRTYDPSDARTNLIRATTAPTKLREGQRVELFEQDGKVRYYALVQEESVAAGGVVTEGQSAAVGAELESLRREVSELKTRTESPTAASGEALTAELESLRAEVSELKTRADAPTASSGEAVSAELESLRAEVAELKTRREEAVVAAQPTEEAAAEMESLRAELAKVRSDYEEAIATRDREITTLNERTTELQTNLSEMNELRTRISRLERPG